MSRQTSAGSFVALVGSGAPSAVTFWRRPLRRAPPLSVITAALTNGEKLRLRAGCCYEVTWDATEDEREQLREYWLSTTMDEEQPQLESSKA